MDQKQPILIISAPIGSGHVKVARALGASIQRQAAEMEVRYVNVFDFLSPAIGRFILRLYLQVLQICPAAYGAAYHWGNGSRAALAGRELISRYLAGRMHSYITAVNPAAIICTHATPAGLVAYLKRHRSLKTPAAAVVTDYIVHRLWVYPELDWYFVANQELQEYLQTQGIDPTRTMVTGIPVGDGFATAVDKESVLASLKLAGDCKTVLIMGGGAGVLPMEEIITACDAVGKPLQLIAVCGTNERLRSRLLAKGPTLKHCTLRPLGFVDNVHELMAIADILVSKSGGATSAEALSRGLPFLIYRPIPGQEEANTRYLAEHSVARRIDSPAALKAAIADLLFADPAGLEAMGSRAAALGQPGAAGAAARKILEIIRQNLLD